MIDQNKIRNVAIIAHIDHGKTTLVDFLLKQSHTFRENSEEMGKELIMDSNDLERERGITILAKNNAIHYKDYKINIIDTPGHADFGGEVERTLAMADGCILLVDAQEGPMPQTRVVLQKALDLELKPIVVINKIDKQARRIKEVLDEVSTLFLELAKHESQLEYPVIYAISREGKAWLELPEDATEAATLEPVFEKIVSYIPAPKGDVTGPFQMLVTALDYDEFKGSYAIGKIARGVVTPGLNVIALGDDLEKKARIEAVFTWEGLKRSPATEAGAGDIVALTGLDKLPINTTICDAGTPERLPSVAIEEPTLKVTIGANTSPFVGRDGTLLTARQLRERLERELEVNVAMRMETGVGDKFLLRGRGELHLSILFETLRREGFEFEVSKPAVVLKEEHGQTLEPWEEVMIDVPEAHRGIVVSELAKRRAELKDTFQHGPDIRFVYEMPTRALLGLRNVLMTATRGSFVLNSHFIHFAPMGAPIERARNGVLIAHEPGKAVAFGLNIAQGRGTTFIDPGVDVYEGMIVGENSRQEDMDINVCKGKELSNMRSKSSDGLTLLAPATKFTLEQCLDYIEDDELLEITPKDVRMRKKYLSKTDRARAARNEKN